MSKIYNDLPNPAENDPNPAHAYAAGAAAYRAAMQTAGSTRSSRRRWVMQNKWDHDNLETVSTRLTKDHAQQFRRICRKAGISRYTILQFMVRVFCIEWEAQHDD